MKDLFPLNNGALKARFKDIFPSLLNDLFFKAPDLLKLVRDFKRVYNIGSEVLISTESADDCLICHELARNAILTVCEHIYCSGCINIWRKDNDTCSYCRQMKGSKWMERDLRRTEERLERDLAIHQFLRLSREDKNAVYNFVREMRGEEGYATVY